MAHHGYIELEGGTQMIEFIVSQCSLPDDPPVSCHRNGSPWLHELEGGTQMIGFIVSQCSLPDDPPVSCHRNGSPWLH